jgi:subtilisin
MATPHVTGAVALLMSTDVAGTVYDTNKNGKWDPAEVRSRLQSTATDLGATGRDNYYGYGLVNAYAAVSGLNSAPADPTEPVVTPPEPSPTPEETETEPVVTPPEPSTPVVMYVGELSLEQQSKVSGKNTFGWAVATVKAVDADGKAVAGANVAGSWSGLTKASVSGTTDANGVVVFTSAQVKNPRGTLTFTVTGITCDGYTYDPTQNVCSSKSVMF